MKVKIFKKTSVYTLEEMINNFLEEIIKDYEVIDIKYIYDCDEYEYSVLIMYKPKLILHVEKINECNDRIMEAYEKNLERVNGVLL